MFRTGLVIGLAVALIGFTAQPSVADNDDDGGGGDKNITVNVTVDNTQIENTLNTIVQRLDAILAGQQNTTVNVTTESGDYEFVGFTAATIDGLPGGGVPTVFATCQAEFGPTARMCTRREFFLTPTISYPGVAAWLIVQHGVDNPTDRAAFGCTGFTNNIGNNGGVVNPDGTLNLNKSCDVPRPVTCCARVTQAP